MDMERPRSNKGVIVILVIVIIALLAAVAYLVYDKQKPSSVDTTTNTTNTNTNTNNDNTNVVEPDNGAKEEVKDFEGPATLENITELFNKSLDSNANRITPVLTESELATNFKNLDKSSGKYKIAVSCRRQWSGGTACAEYTVNVNSALSYNDSFDGCSSTNELYSYNDYIVRVNNYGCVNAIKIFVYDSNNKLVFGNNQSTAVIYDINAQDYSNKINVAPIIINGKLYFMEEVKDQDKLKLMSVDLNSSTLSAKTEGELAAKYEVYPG